MGTDINIYVSHPQCGAGLQFANTTGGGTAEQKITAMTTFTTGTWKHIAVTLSGNTGILYVDGVEVARNTSLTLKPSSLGLTSQNYIGSRNLLIHILTVRLMISEFITGL